MITKISRYIKSIWVLLISCILLLALATIFYPKNHHLKNDIQSIYNISPIVLYGENIAFAVDPIGCKIHNISLNYKNNQEIALSNSKDGIFVTYENQVDKHSVWKVINQSKNQVVLSCNNIKRTIIVLTNKISIKDESKNTLKKITYIHTESQGRFAITSSKKNTTNINTGTITPTLFNFFKKEKLNKYAESIQMSYVSVVVSIAEEDMVVKHYANTSDNFISSTTFANSSTDIICVVNNNKELDRFNIYIRNYGMFSFISKAITLSLEKWLEFTNCSSIAYLFYLLLLLLITSFTLIEDIKRKINNKKMQLEIIAYISQYGNQSIAKSKIEAKYAPSFKNQILYFSGILFQYLIYYSLINHAHVNIYILQNCSFLWLKSIKLVDNASILTWFGNLPINLYLTPLKITPISLLPIVTMYIFISNTPNISKTLLFLLMFLSCFLWVKSTVVSCLAFFIFLGLRNIILQIIDIWLENKKVINFSS